MGVDCSAQCADCCAQVCLPAVEVYEATGDTINHQVVASHTDAITQRGRLVQDRLLGLLRWMRVFSDTRRDHPCMSTRNNIEFGARALALAAASSLLELLLLGLLLLGLLLLLGPAPADLSPEDVRLACQWFVILGLGLPAVVILFAWAARALDREGVARRVDQEFARSLQSRFSSTRDGYQELERMAYC